MKPTGRPSSPFEPGVAVAGSVIGGIAETQKYRFVIDMATLNG
jgi:hypothetical protein